MIAGVHRRREFAEIRRARPHRARVHDPPRVGPERRTRDANRLPEKPRIGAENILQRVRPSAADLDCHCRRAGCQETAGERQRGGGEIGELVVSRVRAHIEIAAFERPQQPCCFRVVKREPRASEADAVATPCGVCFDPEIAEEGARLCPDEGEVGFDRPLASLTRGGAGDDLRIR